MGLRSVMVIPREHGAWFMLLLSLFMGAGTARSFGLPFVFLGLAAIAVFSGLYSLGEGTKKLAISRQMRRDVLSSIVYFFLAAILAAPLFLAYQMWPLLLLSLLAVPFSGIYIYLALQRKHRTAWGELVNIAGISFPAAASYYVSTGEWSGVSLLLWLLTFLYSASSVFYVRLKVRQKAPLAADFSQRLKMGKLLLLYMLFLFSFLTLMAAADKIRFVLLLAYLPLLIKSLHSIFFSGGTTSIKKVGFTEAGHTVLFAALFLLFFQ